MPRVRITVGLGDVWRAGEVVDLPADTARAFTLAGYAVEVLEPMGEGDEGDGPDPRPPAGQ
jgi:hypothetical protein